jgi:hypothetical protein
VLELRRLADSLEQDWEAVQAALAISYSNGMVEGHINRLKMLKRQMYGRASRLAAYAPAVWANSPVYHHTKCGRAKLQSALRPFAKVTTEPFWLREFFSLACFRQYHCSNHDKGRARQKNGEVLNASKSESLTAPLPSPTN